MTQAYPASQPAVTIKSTPCGRNLNLEYFSNEIEKFQS